MAPLTTPWDELKIAELRRLWAAGYSARDIAHELGIGITRMAVLGKVNRLGLERRKEAAPRKPREFTVKRGRPILRPPVFVAPSPDPPPDDPPEKPKEQPTEAPGMRKLQLLVLREHHCRWPIGEPGQHPFYFCAADRTKGETYCEFHKEKAFVKQRPR